MTKRPAMRPHAALRSAPRPEAETRLPLRTAFEATAACLDATWSSLLGALRPSRASAMATRNAPLAPALGAEFDAAFDAEAARQHGWRAGLNLMLPALLRSLLGVLPLLMVALWHAAALAQPATAAPVTATPQEAAVVTELQVLQSQQALVSLRKLKMEQGTIELLLHPRSNRYYIAVTSRTGQVRRVVRADSERTAQLGFDSFRRLAGQGEAGRPALLGETLAEAGAVGAAQPQPQPQLEGDARELRVASAATATPVAGAASAAAAARIPAPVQTQADAPPQVQAPAQPQASAQTRALAQAPLQAQTTTAVKPAAPTMAAAQPSASPLVRAPASMRGTPAAAITTATAASTTAADTAAPVASAAPSAAAVLAPPRSPLMDEVLRLQSAGQLTSMRRADNGSFNAQLFFHVGTARYFVVLAHGKDLWRVVQAQDSAQALRTYEELAGQSASLAGDELRRLELTAQTDAAERELRQAQAQARQMAEELEADRRYRAMIQAQESQSRADVSALQQQQRKIQDQLLAEQRRVMELRRQLDPGTGSGASVPGGRKIGAAECRMSRPGVPVPPAERDLPLCGAEGRMRMQ